MSNLIAFLVQQPPLICTEGITFHLNWTPLNGKLPIANRQHRLKGAGSASSGSWVGQGYRLNHTFRLSGFSLGHYLGFIRSDAFRPNPNVVLKGLHDIGIVGDVGEPIRKGYMDIIPTSPGSGYLVLNS